MHVDQGFLPRMWRLCAILPYMLVQPVAHASGDTLSDLIRSVKSQKEAALNPVKVSKPSAAETLRPSGAPPLLWSMTGLNDQFIAVLLVDGKTYRVQSDDLPFWTGPWQVLDMDAGGVLLRRPGRRLFLSAPGPEVRPELFLTHLGVLLRPAATSQSPAPDAGALLSQRLPVQEAPAAATTLPSALTPAQLKASGLPGGQ